MSNFKTLVEQIQKIRPLEERAKDSLYYISQTLERLLKQQQKEFQPTKSGATGGVKPNTGGPSFPPSLLDKKLSQEILKLQRKKKSLEEEIKQIHIQITDLLNQIWALGKPQKLIEQLSDDYPFLLLPIRIETRFVQEKKVISISVPNPNPFGPKKKKKIIKQTIITNFLLVRFLPDDIFINTHEKHLTANEIENGKDFWSKLWNQKVWEDKSEDEEIHKAAWRGIARGHGANRASWIILQTRPTNWPGTGSNAPVFPNIIQKNESWTLAPRTDVMPDKFVVRIYANGNKQEVVGKQIPNPLIVGPDPDNDNDSFEQVGSSLNVDPPMKWLVDFEEALKVGMGVKIQVSNDVYNNGVDKLLVLGLKLTADKTVGQKKLEKLIANHHYGPDGFSLIPQGTPTNNTKEVSAGYSAFRPDLDFLFEVEQKEALISPNSATPPKEKTDGQWLSLALGIEEQPLEHIAYSNFQDIKEARIFNELLWPATGGYYIKHLLCRAFDITYDVDSRETMVQNIKDFFIKNVSGRGPLPAIRVGNQPYGILPVSAYSKIVRKGREDTYPEGLNELLKLLHSSWEERIEKIKTTTNGTGDWQRDFLNIMSLHANSREYFWKIALGPQLYFQYLSNVTSLSNSNSLYLNKLNEALAIFNLPGINPEALPRELMLTWYPYSPIGGKIEADLIVKEPLSENKPIAEAAPENYLAWLGDSNNVSKIIESYLFKAPKSNTVLYRLIKHAFLLEIYEILYKHKKGVPWVEKELLNLDPITNCDAIWKDYLSGKTINVSKIFSVLKPHAPFQNFQNNINLIKDLPTARLERILIEHIDTCSYRLDAWQTGIVNSRLDWMRKKNSKGIYIGAYGWLLDIRREKHRTAVPSHIETPDQFKSSGEKHPLTYIQGNAGFIHAPSLAQATTGAVLRENYLSKNRQTMEVNLNSRRVRLAKEIIEGLGNGQELAALLGYRFERYLHDVSEYTTGVELDIFIYELRKKFPLTAEPDETRTVAVEANNVVHGLNLLHSYRIDKNLTNLLTGPSSTELEHIQSALDFLEDIIDAIADLTMAEGVHQTVLGNHDRAGAILNAIGQGKMIPKPEVIETPRSGIALTQRTGILFKGNPNLPPKWADLTPSPKSKSAARLNCWIATILGDPDKIMCKIQFIVNPEVDTTPSHDVIKLNDLNIQPIDFIFLLNSALDPGSSTLSNKIAYHVREKQSLSRDSVVKIDYKNRDSWPINIKSFYEILSLAKNLFELFAENRAMKPEDLQNASSLDVANQPSSIIDAQELWNRVFNLNLPDEINQLEALKTALDKGNLPDLTNQTTVITTAIQDKFNNLRAKLINLSSFELSGTTPNSFIEYDELARAALFGKAILIIEEFKKRKDAVNAIFNNPPNTNPNVLLSNSIPTINSGEDIIEKIKEALKIILGKGFPVLPKFKMLNHSSLFSAYTDRNNLLRNASSTLVVEDWFQGIAKVRTKMKNWNDLYNMATILTEESYFPSTKLTPLQLPYQANDQWLGIEFNQDVDENGENDFEIAGDPLSLVLNFPNGFPIDSNSKLSGILVDEWTEKIPFKEETTGIAFNYEEPDSEPPQTILLAVSPEINGKWHWEDLMDTLNETLDLAKKRAIDPDILGTNPESSFNPLLPGVMAAISSDNKQTVALNFHDLLTNKAKS